MGNPIDFSTLGFGYIKTPYRYIAKYKDGVWEDGYLSEDDKVVLTECAGVIQYSQAVFEGLKAYRTEDGRIVCFRPDLNASRMASSCKRMVMPVYPEDKYIEAVKMVVEANKDYVPPYGTGASLYIRPVMFGSDAVLGVKSAKEFEFRIFVSPVGPYFKGGAKPIMLRTTDYDRAAPHGTGNIKAGLNYAMSLYAVTEAHEQGYSENVYLDAETRTYVEETGGANIIFITKDKKLVTPKSDSILPSITKRSIIYVAKEILGLEVEERRVPLAEVKEFAECGVCGTAAVISPVGKIVDKGEEICFPSGMDTPGETINLLYNTLRDIQLGKRPAPEGWIYEIA